MMIDMQLHGSYGCLGLKGMYLVVSAASRLKLFT